jgi:hypothetical protein
LDDWGKFFFPEQVCISLESQALQTVVNDFLCGVGLVATSDEIVDDNSVKDELLKKPPLFWRTTEWHSGLKQPREQRRQQGSLVRIGKTTGVIGSVIERFGNSPEIAPAQQLSQPDKYLKR